MSALKTIVQHAGAVPAIARLAARVPFPLRHGWPYVRATRDLAAFGALPPGGRREWILTRIRRIVEFAASQVPFYREWYHRHGFAPGDLQHFADIARIPPVTKRDLLEWPIEERSAACPGRRLANTGGTSGQPLSFYLDAAAGGREAGYMFAQWRRFGYREGLLKLRFRGANLGSLPLRYNPAQDEYLANTYLPSAVVAEAIAHLLDRQPIHYLHGYPSVVHTFASYCRESAPELGRRIAGGLRGILLGSEYPAPPYRSVIEEVFGERTLSWYGHSEMTVLAGERDCKFVYQPFQSYGYVEAVARDDGAGMRLLGTSYDNFASPFIRYDTGDLVEPVRHDDGLLEAFRIAEGRSADFVVDANGHPVSLTALIFGRHHRLFDRIEHLQICQKQPGEAVIVVTMPAGAPADPRVLARDFDATGVDIRFRFECRAVPFRTAAGKTPLKIPAPASTPGCT